MNAPEEAESTQQALRLAQLEIKMLREQLRKTMDEATAREGTTQTNGGVARLRPQVIPTPPAPISHDPFIPKMTPAGAGDRHVLCIEDSEANFRLIETILNDRPGTELAWAENGQQGLAMAATRRPELVLLDLDLPDMHGSDVLASLRAQTDTAATPVIVISADSKPSQIERMLAAGARDYITKPFEIRRFLLMFDEIFPLKN